MAWLRMSRFIDNFFIIKKLIIFIHSHKAASHPFRLFTTCCTSHWSCYQSSWLGSSSSQCLIISFSSCRRFSSFASRKTPRKSKTAAAECRATDRSPGFSLFPSWWWWDHCDSGCRFSAFSLDAVKSRLRKWWVLLPGAFRSLFYSIFLAQESAVVNFRSYYRSVAHYGVMGYTKAGLEIRNLRCEKFAFWRAVYKAYESVIMTHPPVEDHSDCCVAEDSAVDQVKALIASVVDLTRSVRFRQASTSNPTTESQ